MTRHCYDINKCKERKIFIFFEEGALKIHEFNIHFFTSLGILAKAKQKWVWMKSAFI